MPIANINGHRHHWEARGAGDPLVLVHGAATSGMMLLPHFDELSKSFHVIIPDLRGMGGSEHVSSIEPSAWVDDLAGLLNHLGIDSAHCYGVSLGARVVLRLAVDHPARVRSLILDAPIVANDSAGNAQLNSFMTIDNISPERRAAYEKEHGADWATVLRNYFNIRNDPAVQEYLNLRQLCAGVQAPTLLLRGDRDEPVHPLAHAVELLQRMPNARLAVLPKTTTAVAMAAPLKFHALLRDFVKDVVTTPSAAG